jgi:hypothetical protein
VSAYERKWVQCDGCTGGQSVATLSMAIDGPPLGKRGLKYSIPKGWKQFRKSTKGLRRDFCPECVAKGRAK